MDKKKFRQFLALIAFGVILYFVVMNISMIGGWIGKALSVLTPVIIATLLAFILNIMLKFFEERVFVKLWDKHPKLGKHKRGICILITYVVALAIITFLVYFIVTQVVESIEVLISKAPSYITAGQQFLNKLSQQFGLSGDALSDLSTNWNEIVNYAKDYLTGALSSITTAVSKVFNFTISVVSGLINFLMGLLMSIYMLASKEKLLRVFKKFTCSIFKEKRAAGIERWASAANSAYSRFIGGQLTEAFILGALCFIGMSILQLPYAPLVSILVGLGNLIPMLGAYLSAIPSALLILLESPMKALIFLIFIIILQQFENNLIYPKVVGDAVGLDGIFTLLAIVIGGGLFGVAGVMLSVPFAAVLYGFVGEMTNHRLEEKGIEIDSVAAMKEKKASAALDKLKLPKVFWSKKRKEAAKKAAEEQKKVNK